MNQAPTTFKTETSEEAAPAERLLTEFDIARLAKATEKRLRKAERLVRHATTWKA